MLDTLSSFLAFLSIQGAVQKVFCLSSDPGHDVPKMPLHLAHGRRISQSEARCIDAALTSLMGSVSHCAHVAPEVWSCIAYAGGSALSMPLQRLSDLSISTAPTDTKLQEGQKAFDEYAVASSEGREASLKKMPLVPFAIPSTQ